METYEDYDLDEVAEEFAESRNGEDSDGVEEGGFLQSFFPTAEWLVLTFAMIIFVQTFCFRSMSVVGPSMQNTLQPKDGVCVFNMPWSFNRNDVVIVNQYDRWGKTIIKRIIATEGQVINIDGNGDVYVDDEKLEEPYVLSNKKTERKLFLKYPLRVPKGCFFAMGDHRDVSGDSRDFGCFENENVVGKVVFRWWPLSRFRLF